MPPEPMPMLMMGQDGGDGMPCHGMRGKQHMMM